MKITQLRIRNFRLLQDTTLNLKDSLSLLIGKNNSGKTSLIVILEKFFESQGFDWNDFPITQRDKILNINGTTPDADLCVQLMIQIQYGTSDDLSLLSELILDIDPNINTVQILLECQIDKISLVKTLSHIDDKEEKEKYIKRDLARHMSCGFYVFESEILLGYKSRESLVKKDMSILKSLINLQIIHAKRNVSSSEETRKGTRILSELTTKFFNASGDTSSAEFSKINKQMSDMDVSLNTTYKTVFEPFLKNARDFLRLDNLQVVSNLQSNELVSNLSQVVYGDDNFSLPEHLNGLGVMNILFLLLQIEMKKEKISKDGKFINLLIIEEPEAHTHPQMQYIFATQIRKIIAGIDKLQTIITTHSSHIVSQCDFKDIRYLQKDANQNIVIKNFYDELEKKYDDPAQFKFLVQYLTLQSSELFFADKIVFIEGITEKILLPYFIKNFDSAQVDIDYVPLSAQHISFLEVGANAKVFNHFLDFLDIKTLIITDLDSIKKTVAINPKASSGTSVTYPACPVVGSTSTSNQTIVHFYAAPNDETERAVWYQKLLNKQNSTTSEKIHVAYQETENGYHARSFEDAFIHANRDLIKTNADNLWGLKNKDALKDDFKTTYRLTEEILDKKSDFAASILFIGLSQDITKTVVWVTPLYIKEALSWLTK